jgi:hypothetical protein
MAKAVSLIQQPTFFPKRLCTQSTTCCGHLCQHALLTIFIYNTALQPPTRDLWCCHRRKMLQMPDLSGFNKQLEAQMKAAMDQMGAAVLAPNPWGLANTLVGLAIFTSLTGVPVCVVLCK